MRVCVEGCAADGGYAPSLCRDVLYDKAADGTTRVTGLRVGTAGREKVVTADVYVAALDVPGIKQLLPKSWRAAHPQFDAIYKLVGVPVITVQLRYDGWVTEMKVRQVGASIV